MRVGSLFTGIGGVDLGLERAGMTVTWQSEIDPYCCKVLAKHWPDVPNLGDIKTIDWKKVEPVDLLCGGFPCQPVSQAGKRFGQNDERWLWPWFVDAIRELRPRFVLVENVPGLLGMGMGDVLGDMAALGYDAQWVCVSARSVGAPHLRSRVILVAHTDDTGPQGLWSQRELEQGRREVEAAWSAWWATEPGVGRVADGVPHRVDRLRALGNAVVPQVAEWIGRRIMACDPHRQERRLA